MVRVKMITGRVLRNTCGPYMPTFPPVAATRRESAQKKPAFTAGGRRDAEIATPTWPSGKLKKIEVQVEEY